MIKHYLHTQFFRVIKRFHIKRHIKGENNKFVCRSTAIRNIKVTMYGRNNTVFIDDDCFIRNLEIFIFGNNNVLNIEKDVNFIFSKNNSKISLNNSNTRVIIGEHTNFCYGGHKIEVAEDNSEIIIGKGCLFSNDVLLNTSDSHSIMDITTGQRVNKAKSIHIGDRVWIGRFATILKGVNIENDSVVGTHAVVSKKFEEPNVVIVGNPAKIVKHNIRWDKELW